MVVLLITTFLLLIGTSFFIIKKIKKEKEKRELSISLSKAWNELYSLLGSLNSFNGDLYDLFYFHKDIAEKFPSLINAAPAICPDKYGVFRTNSISSMTPSQVFLGGIYGLFTHDIPTWSNCKDNDAYNIVRNQYLSLLRSGISQMMQKINNKISSL